MKILLTNDDGIFAPGLWALHERFSRRHDVTVVAPDRERSAIGHAITLNRPLRSRLTPVNNGHKGHAVNGTPADCIKLALVEILDERPDLVISGVNPGANVGVNINYSGTVSAAKEAALYGVPAVAVSVQGFEMDYPEDAARFAETLVDKLAQRKLPFGTFLNVNLPNLPLNETAGVKISRQGVTRLSEYFEKRMDPRNRPYYWQGLDMQRFEEKDTDIDGGALHGRYISVTPIKCDMTDYTVLEDLKTWDI